MTEEKMTTQEEKNADAQATEMVVSVIVGVVIISLIALVVWALFKFIPPVRGWLDGRLDEETACIYDPDSDSYDADAIYTFCTEKGFEPTDDTDSIASLETACIESGFFTLADTLQETCFDYCSAMVSDSSCTYRPPDNIEPTMLGDYLNETDDLIDQMGRYLGKIEVLVDMYYESGNNNATRAAILNDKQYQKIVDDVHYDARLLYRKLEGIWPPPPYDSSNPLLDSQARLTSAIALVMRVDGLIYRFEISQSSQQWNDINDSIILIQTNMDYAELGLAMAR